MPSQFITRLVAGLLCTIGLTPVVQAADTIPATDVVATQTNRDWVLQVTPYIWASGLKSNISPFRRGPEIEVSKSFADILKDLDFGGFVDVWARYDRIVFSGDLMFVSTSDSRNIATLPIIGPVRGLSASADTELFTTTLQAGYRIYDAPGVSLDLLGGLRYWNVANDVTIEYHQASISYGESFDWTDPLIGMRGFYQITPKLSLQAQADFGGFGVGSKQTWQALGTLTYILTDHLSMSAGYKLLDVDYRSGGHVFDTRMQGPVLGMTYRF